MPTLKPVRWIGSSREDLQSFPTAARRNIGYALHFAQAGDKHLQPSRCKDSGVPGSSKLWKITMAIRIVLSIQYASLRWSTSYMPFRKSRNAAVKPLSESLISLRHV